MAQQKTADSNQFTAVAIAKCLSSFEVFVVCGRALRLSLDRLRPGVFRRRPDGRMSKAKNATQAVHKVIMVGSGGVGKSALTLQFMYDEENDWTLQQFLPRMIELDRGHIVAVASIAGHQGVPYMTDYCASKYAAAGMMEALNMELKFMDKKHIRLTTINPIIITTGLISNVKSRDLNTKWFPCLLPLLTVEKTADVVVRSILKEEEEVFIPKRSEYMKNLIECFTRNTRFKILDYAGYGFDPVITKQPGKNGAEIV
ncbi:protein dhs-3 [Trichonephila clavata]|uniref:Protein dhs-3 n=1 Tax=Trichonephila clavata TaxID=2740835 RepID=A0A8X6FF87_TRICU|nr:protein dhs-3 [Trichonephila clavata]